MYPVGVPFLCFLERSRLFDPLILNPVEVCKRFFMFKQVILCFLDALYGLGLDEIGLLLIVLQLFAVVLVDPFPLDKCKYYSAEIVLEAGAHFLSITEFQLFFLQIFLDLLLHPLHESYFLIEFSLDSMNLLMFLLLVVVLPSNAIELGIHPLGVAILGVLFEEGLVAG